MLIKPRSLQCRVLIFQVPRIRICFMSDTAQYPCQYFVEQRGVAFMTISNCKDYKYYSNPIHAIWWQYYMNTMAYVVLQQSNLICLKILQKSTFSKQKILCIIHLIKTKKSYKQAYFLPHISQQDFSPLPSLNLLSHV